MRRCCSLYATIAAANSTNDVNLTDAFVAAMGLGFIYLQGDGVRRDRVRAYDLFERAWDLSERAEAPRYYERATSLSSAFSCSATSRRTSSALLI